MPVPVLAGEITGNILITKGLTKRSVTLPVYQRGPSLPVRAAEPISSVADELSRVVIYVEGEGLIPATPMLAEIEQRNRGFAPEMTAITVGSTVSFPNTDLIFHNVFSLSKAKEFDLGRYPAGETKSIEFDKPGVVKVHCHLHPNMAATIVVVPNDWYARPETNGSYRIAGVSAGERTVVAWHSSVGFLRKRVHVDAAGSATVNFVLPLREGGGE